MANVLLLRASSGLEDRYEKAFSEAGYHPVSIAVLETVTTNLIALKALLVAGPQDTNLDGVILTSARSCESWKTAVGELISCASSQASAEGKTWKETRFYVVGEATASALRSIEKTYGNTPYTPSVILGESSGTGEKLAQFIVEQPGQRPRRFLYLTGDKNKDTVPSILGEAGIELESLKVYETQGSNSFERDVKASLVLAKSDIKRWWIIHFAPSAADFVTPILNRSLPADKCDLRIAAIGPVTATHLKNVLGLHVDVVSFKPTPQDLLNSIQTKENE